MSQGDQRGASRLLAVIGPGLLVAATGVGAGDLATGAFAGSHVGLAVLWAVPAGAFLKFVLTEGLARWQLATGQTLLEGAVGRLGSPAALLFALYLVPWCLFVGSALVSACGVTAHALAPVFDDAARGKVVFGVLHSALGWVLVRFGGFRLFERVMGACVGLMFAVVVVTAVLVAPSWSEVLAGLVVPRIPEAGGEGLRWTVALLGGVGGTLTVLCYGYWIRQEGRSGPEALATCRLDLAVGYAVTAVFGAGMVVVGSTVVAEGRGAGLVVSLADRLGETLGPGGRAVFLAGAWAAVFSSLLGVWQAVPHVFADFWHLVRRREVPLPPPETVAASRPYQLWLGGLATVPLLGLAFGFRSVQALYAVTGAAFMPLLAAALLVLNGRRAWVGGLTNRPLTVAVLVLTLAFFGWAGWMALVG